MNNLMDTVATTIFGSLSVVSVGMSLIVMGFVIDEVAGRIKEWRRS